MLDHLSSFYRMNQGILRPIQRLFWKVRPALASNPVACGLWEGLFEMRRLKLPLFDLRRLGAFVQEPVLVPGMRQEEHDIDAPLNDLLFLLHLGKRLDARRILEIGTYRAKTAYTLSLNLPLAEIVSFDLERVESFYRSALEANPLYSLRIADFAGAGADLSRERPFDLIFIDAGHRKHEVLADSKIALSILAPGGAIVWHDYRRNEFFNPGLEVPEALHELAATVPIEHAPGTTCALHWPAPAASSPDGAVDKS